MKIIKYCFYILIGFVFIVFIHGNAQTNCNMVHPCNNSCRPVILGTIRDSMYSFIPDYVKKDIPESNLCLNLDFTNDTVIIVIKNEFDNCRGIYIKSKNDSIACGIDKNMKYSSDREFLQIQDSLFKYYTSNISTLRKTKEFREFMIKNSNFYNILNCFAPYIRYLIIEGRFDELNSVNNFIKDNSLIKYKYDSYGSYKVFRIEIKEGAMNIQRAVINDDMELEMYYENMNGYSFEEFLKSYDILKKANKEF